MTLTGACLLAIHITDKARLIQMEFLNVLRGD
jgi:hypothetical protein